MSLTTIVAKYAAHADVVATNVISVLSNTAPAKEYKGSPELIILTNGKVRLDPFPSLMGLSREDIKSRPDDCCVYRKLALRTSGSWGIVLGNWFASMMKSKGLMIPMGRKGYGHAE